MDKPIGSNWLYKCHALLYFGIQPIVLSLLGQYDNHALFVVRLVKTLQQAMILRIDRQHGEAQYKFPGGRMPRRPQTRNAHRLAVGSCYPGHNSFATAPVRLINGFSRNDAALAISPYFPKAWFLCCRLTA